VATDPIATYGAKILARDGFRMSGDQRSGLKATVKYRVPWENGYLFLNAMVNPVDQQRIGLITYTLPYRLPAAVAATPVYAASFDLQPMGLRDDLTSATVLPYNGLAAGEFYRYAIVTINFEQASFSWDATDDPNGLQQLDPANPIPLCEQSIKFHEKMITLKGHRYRYVSDGKAVDGEYAVPKYGADIMLRFPHVPYQPWQLGLSSYLNKVNSAAIFLCDPGTLLFGPPDTTVKQSMLGSSVASEQSVTLVLKFNPDGWNKLLKPDGSLDDVVKASGGSIYDAIDFRPLFQRLAFTEAT
jgi:hypothetical protein